MCRRFSASAVLLRPPLPLMLLFLLVAALAPRSFTQTPGNDWLEIVRQTPYWSSQGAATNLATIRRWVLLDRSYCREQQRHVLFDSRGRFIGYVNNGDNPAATIERLNAARQRMAQENRVDDWRPGALENLGYPFALACHQPHADISQAVARMIGASEEDRVWGTWDGMRVGTVDQPVSLVQLFREVYQYRKQQARFTFPETVMPIFLGKTMIESGGQKNALSGQAARGILQLRPNVLKDCEIPPRYHLHRMAQADCALRLMEQNHRNLAAPFEAVFSGLAPAKRTALYDLLLVQSYQIGVGRMIELLQDEELGQAAAYFAANARRFSAADILVGMIYHNMGRRDLGLRSLYYVTDAHIATETLCASTAMAEDPWCKLYPGL